ncbi:MAG: hypothetical protein ABSA59_03190 [Terriglobia bacterium]
MPMKKGISRRRFLQAASVLTVGVPPALSIPAQGAGKGAVVLENDLTRYVIGADGRNHGFVDKRTGRDYCRHEPFTAFLSLKKGGQAYPPSHCEQSAGKITTEFAEARVTVTTRVVVRPRYFTLEVTSVEGVGVEELTLSDLRLNISQHLGKIANVAWDGEFAAAVMALNLQVNAGGKCDAGFRCEGQARLWSACYPKFGLQGAKIGLLGCPTAELRRVIQEMLLRDGFVHSELGGAWALDAPETNYSYLFADPSEADVDEWITLARLGGFKEVLVSEIGPYGHYHPHPAKYPHGLDGVKRVVDRIHAAGLKAGWHMLAFGIAKNDPWVRPVPDPHLAVRSTLTLAAPVSAEATFVPTVECPQDLPVHAGYWFRGGMDVLVEKEILTYQGLQTSPPFGLTGCRRGAHGTASSAHARGATLGNLQEVFDLYVPDPNSGLMEDMEQRLADIIRTCGFDKVYFDGLDGADVFAGSDWSWYYGPKFALEVFRRAQSPLQVEASAWYHHTWHITSRLGAWDHPVRDPKRFIDLHVDGNAGLGDLLHTQLGWWALQNYKGRLGVAATSDVIEYLGAKCLANNMAFSLEEITPADLRNNPNWARLLPILGKYEALRLGGGASEAVKARLRLPGEEFTLESRHGRGRFLPVTYSEHKVTAVDGIHNVIKVTNPYAAQLPRLRIQALWSAAPYGTAGNMMLADGQNPGAFRERRTAPGVSCDLEVSAEQVTPGIASGRYTARSHLAERRGAWAMIGTAFLPPLDMAACPALGVWVYGDGKGEILNFQLVDVRGPDPAVGEHYIDLNFTGWRYFELIEPEGKRWSDYVWPYDNALAVYRETPNDAQIAALNIYYNHLPPREAVSCLLSSVRALAVEKVKLENPRLTVGSKTLKIPVAMESGCYVEFNSPQDCKLYNPDGVFLRECAVEGNIPRLAEGENQLVFACDGPRGYNARALVTTMAIGSPLGE